MRPSILVLSVVAILFSGCHRDSSDASIVPLSFYLVSDEKIDGGRFIDAPDFPKLGYIAASPDLVITRLETVSLETSIPYSRERPAISIVMHSEDAQQFTALTERAAGKTLLVMLGDTPLTAPKVMERIPTASMMLVFGTKVDSKQIKNVTDCLKKLVQ